MKNILLIIGFSMLPGFAQQGKIVIDKAEARSAYNLLMDIRKNPAKYAKELGYDQDLQPSKAVLHWNDTLAKVAERKAYDMANRNYFDHVDPDGYGMNYFINKSGYKLNPDWVTDKSNNFFESLSAGDDNGLAAIKGLITDSDDPNVGHRKHLLGLDPFYANLKDIGIGFCKRDSGSEYPTYMCVIIAKHDF